MITALHEPYRYNDFKFMRCDMKEGSTLSEMAKAVDLAQELIIKNSGSLIDLNFDFIIF